MNRADYLLLLEQELAGLQPHARQEVLDYFQEYFEEKGDDQKAIQDLGKPREAAQEIMANLPSDELISESPLESRTVFQATAKEPFNWKKLFHDSSPKTNEINVQTVEAQLPDFRQLKLELESMSLIVQVGQLEKAQLRYQMNPEETGVTLDYQLEGDCLVLKTSLDSDRILETQSEDSYAILSLPQRLLPLTNLSLTLSDSKLTIRNLDLVDLFCLDLSDSSLTLSQLQVQEECFLKMKDGQLSVTKLETKKLDLIGDDVQANFSQSNCDQLRTSLSDCQINFNRCQLTTGDLDLTDCVGVLEQLQLADRLNCQADDCVLSIQLAEPFNLELEADDSVLHLPKEMMDLLNLDEEPVILDYSVADCPSKLTLRCNDCRVTLA
ncbi:DUF1700 domain-containing protein [Streptococcus suis]|uniref:DUF1700 domain-containing protein n=1 Tax=Streptococcus suis TaxID=1307 RepID=UPI001ABE8D98|nr:DUF4097 family beta strand repeat protein [Streptococcus suis]